MKKIEGWTLISDAEDPAEMLVVKNEPDAKFIDDFGDVVRCVVVIGEGKEAPRVFTEDEVKAIADNIVRSSVDEIMDVLHDVAGDAESAVKGGSGLKFTKYRERITAALSVPYKEEGMSDRLSISESDLINFGDACWWSSHEFWKSNPTGEAPATTIKFIARSRGLLSSKGEGNASLGDRSKTSAALSAVSAQAEPSQDAAPIAVAPPHEAAWVSVETDLPKRGVVVIACHQPSRGVYPARTIAPFGPDEPEIEWIDPLGGVRDVTHWMPLPPAPPQQ